MENAIICMHVAIVELMQIPFHNSTLAGCWLVSKSYSSDFIANLEWEFGQWEFGYAFGD